MISNTSVMIEPTNPLLREWPTPFEAPPFSEITPEHFRPAFAAALADHEREIAATTENDREPTFANTVEALELGGRTLRRVSAVFFNLTGAHTNEAIEKVERDVAPILAKHRNAIFLNEALFKRVASLKERQKTLGLSPE